MKCSIENCQNEIMCKGYCNSHYLKLQRHGDPLWERVLNKDGVCQAPGCTNNVKTKELCPKHYKKMRETGTLEKLKHGGPALSELSLLDGMKDPRPGYRGYFAANTVDDIRNKARKRGKEWELTPVETYKLIIAPCSYCGHTPNWPENRVGIDRVVNEIGYTPENSVSCCFTCNSAKKELSREEFLEWVKRIYSHLFKEKV